MVRYACGKVLQKIPPCRARRRNLSTGDTAIGATGEGVCEVVERFSGKQPKRVERFSKRFCKRLYHYAMFTIETGTKERSNNIETTSTMRRKSKRRRAMKLFWKFS